MTTIAIDQFFPLVIPDVPGCLNASIREAVAASAHEFCASSKVWRVITDSVNTVAGTSDYAVTLPGLLEHIWSFSVNGIEIDPANTKFESLQHVGDSGFPQRVSIVDTSIVRLYPTPETAYAIRVSCSLKPARTALSLESTLYDHYAETIASGAIYRLTRTPGKPWSNPEVAGLHKTLFDQGIDEALHRDQHSVPVRARPRWC